MDWTSRDVQSSKHSSSTAVSIYKDVYLHLWLMLTIQNLIDLQSSEIHIKIDLEEQNRDRIIDLCIHILLHYPEDLLILSIYDCPPSAIVNRNFPIRNGCST